MNKCCKCYQSIKIKNTSLQKETYKCCYLSLILVSIYLYVICQVFFSKGTLMFLQTYALSWLWLSFSMNIFIPLYFFVHPFHQDFFSFPCACKIHIFTLFHTSHYHVNSPAHTCLMVTLFQIDADSLSGICFPGFYDSWIRTGFVLVPIGVALVVGAFFSVRGQLFIYLAFTEQAQEWLYESLAY